MQRRFFLKQSGLMAAGAGFSKFIPIAGPFSLHDFPASGIPPDKKLDPAWVRSLYERGQATIYRKSRQELRYIGMPVGGICCGNVYLGGDGRLWLWDIFNRNQNGAIPKTLPISLEGFNVKEINNTFGTLYLEPALQQSPFQQGFALLFEQGGKKIIRRLQAEDWEEIEFTATYPVAQVRYIQRDFPVEVSLKAFSPFIPGDEWNSGLPVTLQSISVRNLSDQELSVSLVGWLENRILPETGKTKKDFRRVNHETGQGIALSVHTDNADIRNAADFGSLFFCSASDPVDVYPSLKALPDTLSLPGWLQEEEDAPMALLSRTFPLPGAQTVVTDFMISWHMPNLTLSAIPDKGRYYTRQFDNAAAVASYVAGKYQWLRTKTMLWYETWYDSTLPWWFLERTFQNVSILATTTSHRLSSGRFYGWEGIGCCEGTCTHVWQYAQAAGRIFPALERDTRERVDLGISLLPDGAIGYRGEANQSPAIDGQAGTILRFYREHQMSPTDDFLKNNWNKIKRTLEFLLAQDKDKDGMEDTPLENTLDAVWKGEISWIVGLCLAAARAGEAMALEMGDENFAAICREYAEKGRKNMERYLFNGEYFIHRPDPVEGRKEIGSYNTCHIDQVYGQSWAWQVGLGRILDREKTLSALRSLWKYNYMPDVGPYIKKHPGGRFYALAGDGGMVMNTNPRQEEHPYGNAKAWQLGYFSECMSGFEHQVASHMMAEGMTDESLVLTKSIHDRYHALKRNPFNEIECSDHYARAMASYGSFISACGFEYNGPRGTIGFAPRWGQGNFKAAFTAAEGWGSYHQWQEGSQRIHRITLQQGRLFLKRISLPAPDQTVTKEPVLMLAGKPLKSTYQLLAGEPAEKMIFLLPGEGIRIGEGEMLEIQIHTNPNLTKHNG